MTKSATSSIVKHRQNFRLLRWVARTLMILGWLFITCITLAVIPAIAYLFLVGDFTIISEILAISLVGIVISLCAIVAPSVESILVSLIESQHRHEQILKHLMDRVTISDSLSASSSNSGIASGINQGSDIGSQIYDLAFKGIDQPDDSQMDSGTFQIICPGCSTLLPGNDLLIGRNVKCQKCQMRFEVNDKVIRRPEKV